MAKPSIITLLLAVVTAAVEALKTRPDNTAEIERLKAEHDKAIADLATANEQLAGEAAEDQQLEELQNKALELQALTSAATPPTNADVEAVSDTFPDTEISVDPVTDTSGTDQA